MLGWLETALYPPLENMYMRRGHNHGEIRAGINITFLLQYSFYHHSCKSALVCIKLGQNFLIVLFNS